MPSKSLAQQHLTLEDAAYIAGFFDGEGCLSMRCSNEARGKTWPRRISVQEDLDIRESFKTKFTGLNKRGVENASSQ